jgi:hypothetical protein
MDKPELWDSQSTFILMNKTVASTTVVANGKTAKRDNLVICGNICPSSDCITVVVTNNHRIAFPVVPFQ